MTHLSEAIWTEILARLPLRSISRFKSVCKTWKWTLESAYFRSLFVALHRNSSLSWSLMSLSRTKELVGFHGCKTWGLPKSLVSFIPQAFQRVRPNYMAKFKHEASSNGLVMIQGFGNACFVGNPVLQQWVKIPLEDYDGLMKFVTRVDDDGVVFSFKVVCVASLQKSSVLSLSLYSSETGIWTKKVIHFPCEITSFDFMNLNGVVYFSPLSEPGVFVAHDLYSESDQVSVVQYPDYSSDNNSDFKRALTTCGGVVMYVRTLSQTDGTGLKVWRLNIDDSWQLLWEIVLPIIGNCVPMAMHPFDSGIAFLWSRQNRHLVSCNLRTQNYMILKDDDDCFIDQSVCDQHMDDTWRSRSPAGKCGASVEVLQFVLPRWMESVPCPPHVEMIDTTSLLSYIASMHKRRYDRYSLYMSKAEVEKLLPMSLPQ